MRFHDSRIRIRETFQKIGSNVDARLSPADLFDLFFLIFPCAGFLNCRFESLDGVAGGTFSRSFASTTTAKSSLKVLQRNSKEIRKELCAFISPWMVKIGRRVGAHACRCLLHHRLPFFSTFVKRRRISALFIWLCDAEEKREKNVN